MNRKKSRELAMKLLYQMTINKQDYNSTIENLKESVGVETTTEKDLKDIDMQYLEGIIKGVENRRDILDGRIQRYLKNWSLNRISKVDITILRICTYEFLYENDIPKNVSINEAVELAKMYGEDKSPSFINGVLGNMIKDVDKD